MACNSADHYDFKTHLYLAINIHDADLLPSVW